MALWNRINQSKINFLSNQLKRCYVQIPCNSSLNYTATSSKSRVLENPVWGFVKKPSYFCNNVRFFAAPIQAKAKKEENDASGPRLNDKITAQVVRLVSDEGHTVVSLREALEKAKRLELDLVEVQRNVNPPVCKIMNFNQEKYKKEQKEKDRAKSKPGETLRKGDHKEVRFAAKTEQKDLEMKADMVKRLMDRGYRVKCMAMGNTKKHSKSKGRSNEDSDDEEFERKKEEKEMLALLSRLTTLIEDVAIVDSGQKVGKKLAYVIVRHVKFGASKKGGAKKDKLANAQPTAKQSAPTKVRETFKEESTEFDLEAEDDSADDFDKVFDFDDATKGPSINHLEGINSIVEPATASVEFNVPKLSHPRPADDARNARPPSSLPGPPPGMENRYRRSEPMNQFPQTSIDNKGPGNRDSFRFEPQFSNQRRQPQPQPQMNATPSMGERKQVRPDPLTFRNLKPPNETPKQDASSPATAKPASSYGIFSSAKAAVPGKQGVVADMNKNSQGNSSDAAKNSSTGKHGSNPNLPSSKSDGTVDQGGQKGFGIFSRGIPTGVSKDSKTN